MAVELVKTSPNNHQKQLSVINYDKLVALLGDPDVKITRKSSAIMTKEEQILASKAVVPIDHNTFMKEYKNIFMAASEQRERRRRLKMDKFYRNTKRSMEEMPAITSGKHDDSTETISDDAAEVSSAGATVALRKPHEVPSNEECLLQTLLQREKKDMYTLDHRVERHLRKPMKQQKQGRLAPVLPKMRCAELEKLLFRMPYERSQEDSIQVLNILQNYEPVARQMPIFQLKELVLTATLERYDDNGVIVFAGSGLHIILSGSVKPLVENYLVYLEGDETSEKAAPAENKEEPSTKKDSERQRKKQPKQQSTNEGGLFSELLKHEPTGMSITSEHSLLPAITERESTSSRDSAGKSGLRRHVSFVQERDGPGSSSQSQRQASQSSSKRPSRGKPDTADTLEKFEMVRVATMEASGSVKSRQSTNVSTTLRTGECFGTLRLQTTSDSLEGRAMLCRINEPKTVLLKLSATSYERISKALTQRQLDKKVNLIASCEAYRYWSRLSLEHLAKCATWLEFPPGTVLAAEGEVCPYAGYFLSGECRLARRIFVKEKNLRNRQVSRRKEVIMGLFTPGNSFGERSLMADEPMRYTLITVTQCEFAIINEDSIQNLEGSVKQLLGQVEPTGPSLEATAYREDDIYEEYIKQESDRRWANFRHQVVNKIINYQGIMPGYGRWAKS